MQAVAAGGPGAAAARDVDCGGAERRGRPGAPPRSAPEQTVYAIPAQPVTPAGKPEIRGSGAGLQTPPHLQPGSRAEPPPESPHSQGVSWLESVGLAFGTRVGFWTNRHCLSIKWPMSISGCATQNKVTARRIQCAVRLAEGTSINAGTQHAKHPVGEEALLIRNTLVGTNSNHKEKPIAQMAVSSG